MGSNSKVIEVKIRRIFLFKENQIFCLMNDDMEIWWYGDMMIWSSVKDQAKSGLEVGLIKFIAHLYTPFLKSSLQYF